MCQAIQEMIEEGRNEGDAQGQTRILRLTSAMVMDNCADQITQLSTDASFLQEMLMKYNI